MDLLKRISKSLRYFILSLALRSVYALAKIIPRKLGLSVFAFFGYFAFLISRKEKKRTLDHLQFIYGDRWNQEKIRKTARDVFTGLGKNLYDAVYFSGLSGEKLNRLILIDDMEEFKKAAAKNRGVFAITAHIGCFEMLLHYFAQLGYPCFAIGKQMKDERIDRLVRKLRSGPNIEYMDRSQNSRKLLRFLREGRVCGVLVDQDTDVEGVFADFMGKPAFSPSGPVRIAMKSDIPVFVITTVRLDDDRHRVFLSEEVVLEKTGNFDADLHSNVQKVNNIICKTIEQYPSQWVWMHRRWKKQPSKAEVKG